MRLVKKYVSSDAEVQLNGFIQCRNFKIDLVLLNLSNLLKGSSTSIILRPNSRVKYPLRSHGSV